MNSPRKTSARERVTRKPSIVRSRTLIIGNTKGGVSKTSLSSSIAYEAARLGLTVCVADSDSGFSSVTGTYAGRYIHPETGQTLEVKSLADAVRRGEDAPFYPVPAWTPDPNVPWLKGGPAIPGGKIFISPAAAETDRENLTSVVSESGGIEEMRLMNALETEWVRENADLVIIDMPGIRLNPLISSMLHAAEHVIFPFYPEWLAHEELAKFDEIIGAWESAHGKPINFLGAIPTSIPLNLRRAPGERRIITESAKWLEDTFGDAVGVIAPGIERRKAFARSQEFAIPISTYTRTQIERRDVGTIPAALAKTALTVLSKMLPKEDDPTTSNRINYDIEAMREALIAQEMPDDWRGIIEGPDFIDWKADWLDDDEDTGTGTTPEEQS